MSLVILRNIVKSKVNSKQKVRKISRLKNKNVLEDKIISLYVKGMSVSDIKLQLEELYGGVEISTSLISKVTVQYVFGSYKIKNNN